MTTSDSATSAEQGLTIERVFNAPRDLVWQAFTDPEHFKRWYGPASMTAHVCEIDLRVGGSHLFGLGAGDGVDYWTTGVYQEIVPPERLVATDVQSDEDGNAMPGTPETVVSVVLEDLGDGRTRVTLSQTGWPDEMMAQGASGGWNQALDKLEAQLAAA